MNNIKDIKFKIAASLWLKSGTVEELKTRDFLKNYAIFSIERILMMMECDELIFEKNYIWYTYNKSKNILKKHGYDLNDYDHETPHKRNLNNIVLKETTQNGI